MKKLTLEYVGRDSWSRPVYVNNGKLYVDVNPRRYYPPDIYTKNNNAFDGEPCDPVKADFIFQPARDTWG